MQILGISTDDTRSALVLELEDGARHALDYTRLRLACRCAECTAVQRRGGVLEAGPVKLRAIEPVGAQALNLQFSDGHARGIYPFPYLIELATA